MNTRSTIRKTEEMNPIETSNTILNKPEYDVNIDFDEASSAWKANKRSIGGGCYRYICEAITGSGNKCKKTPISGGNFCSQHSI